MKIGILGGTFNPIHLGHIRLAEEALEKFELDKVIFIPTYIPPHKINKDIISFQNRYKMVELAIEEKSNFEVSDLEVKLKGISYSVNTIKELKKIYDDTTNIYFVVGSDYAEELGLWKDIEDLKKLCKFAIITRLGNISSTNIRKLIRERKPFKNLLPQKVYDYILMNKLYK